MSDASQDAGKLWRSSPQGEKGLHEGGSEEVVRQVALEQAEDG
ncbi:hypothetical protein [Pollutimonas nitritireducens]|nr:hypothetical protein [Pollutimonas nitritireducens]